MTKGILAFGAYIPLAPAAAQGDRRHARLVQSGAQGPGQGRARLLQLGRGRRDHGRGGRARLRSPAATAAAIAALRFASTTFPFLDRLHSGIVAGALSLAEDVSAIDVAATQRAGTSALIEALGERQRDAGGRRREARRQGGEPGRDDERRRRGGHPGRRGQADRHAAGQGLAHRRFRRSLPLRRQPVRLPVGGALDPRRRLHADRAAGDQALPGGGQGGGQGRRPTSACRRRWRASPTRSPRRPASTTRPCAIRLHANCGDTGAAHALLLLVAALEKAKPGDKILVVGFGQGADALLFEVTPEIAKRPKSLGVAGHLARRKEETNYGRFLAFNDLIELERGMRSETDKAHAAVVAVAQPRDGHELHRRQVLQVRHAAVPQDRHLRQPELQRHRHARSRTPSPTWPAASSPTRPTASPTRPIRRRAMA